MLFYIKQFYQVTYKLKIKNNYISFYIYNFANNSIVDLFIKRYTITFFVLKIFYYI